MKTLLTITLSSLIFAGCASNTLPDQTKYDQTDQAKIRLFGQNGKPTIMKLTVNGKKVSINQGGGFSSAFGSLVGATSNHSLGIPETEITKKVLDSSHIFSKITYSEYIIPANNPIQIHSAIIPVANIHTGYHKTTYRIAKGCDGKSIEFTPEAGAYYEVAPMSSSSKCGVTIFTVIEQDGRFVAVPLQ